MRRALLERVVRQLAGIDRPSASDGERRAAEWLAEELALGRLRGAYRGGVRPRRLLVAARHPQRRPGAAGAPAVAGAVGARGRRGRRGGLGRRERRPALVPARRAAARDHLERGRGDRRPPGRAHDRVHRPSRRRPQRPRVPPRAAPDRHAARPAAARACQPERADHVRGLPRAGADRARGAAAPRRAAPRRALLRAGRHRQHGRHRLAAGGPGRQRQPELGGGARGAGP